MFSRLYAYRERSDVAPLENFVTEPLAEVFGRLPAYLQISFSVALVPRADGDALSKLLSGAGRIELRTQVSIPSAGAAKRPDLVLYADGRALLVIEAKVAAALQGHAVPGDGLEIEGERLDQHQLRTYAGWIAGRTSADPWPGAITFLTTRTPPPEDFSEGRYLGAASAVRSWKDVGDWIVREVDIADRQTTHCALAAELRNFLQKRKLMTRYMSTRDLAAAALFAPSSASLHETFGEVMKVLGKHEEKLKGARQIRTEFWSEGNVFWGWFHFAKSVNNNSSKPYVAVGICFEVAEPWSADAVKLPGDEPFFFVSSADDWGAEKPAAYLTRIPADWVPMQEGWTITATRPVSRFAPDPDARVEELKAWATGRLDELVACIPDYAIAPVEAAASDADGKAEA